MGLGHSDPWVGSHMWPQQTWHQRSCKGQWPLVQVLEKRSLYQWMWIQWSILPKKKNCIHFRRVLCLLEESTTQDKKIKKASSYILWHTENAKYSVKYGYLESFSYKKIENKNPFSSFFSKTRMRNMFIFLLGLKEARYWPLIKLHLG